MSNKSNKSKKNKTKITRISANSSKSNSTPAQNPETKPPVTQTNPQTNSKDAKITKSTDKKTKKPFILFRPFIALGHYLRGSWQELRQVRWPNRKLTWKMTVAVLIYCAIFIVFIVLLDMFFTFIFNLLLS